MYCIHSLMRGRVSCEWGGSLGLRSGTAFGRRIVGGKVDRSSAWCVIERSLAPKVATLGLEGGCDRVVVTTRRRAKTNKYGATHCALSRAAPISLLSL